MSPNTIHATQAAHGIQCETLGTVLLDHAFGTQKARIGHMAKSCLVYLTCYPLGLSSSGSAAPLCEYWHNARTSAAIGDP